MMGGHDFPAPSPVHLAPPLEKVTEKWEFSVLWADHRFRVQLLKVDAVTPNDMHDEKFIFSTIVK